MLFKFKSQATADVLMLEVNGRQLLEIMGKEPSRQGIVTVAQLPGAVAALQAAIAQAEAAPTQRVDSDEHDEDSAKGVSVSLRQRSAPLIEQLQRSAAAGKDVLWSA